MIGLILLAIALCVMFGLGQWVKPLARTAIGLALLVTAIPIAISECSSSCSSCSRSIPSWIILVLIAIGVAIAYSRYRARRERLSGHFRPPNTSQKRRVDR